MADTTTVVEGKVKYRDGRKWKPRWCVLKKPSPVADRLQVLLYKDVKEAIKDGCKPKSCFPIEHFYGLQSGFTYEKENNIMAIICQKQITLFSFENREDLIQFEIKIRRSLGEEHQFPVRIHKMPSHSKLPQDLIRMHIQGQKFCLTSNVPPKILQCWQISDLRRFGTVEGKFLFEGGSRCNKGAGLHALISEQIEDIGEIIRLAAMGRTSGCQRMADKRGSKFSDAFDSFNTFSNIYNNNPLRVEDRPSAVNCCNDNLNETDEMGFHKRHSISVMDYRRMASLSEKFKQMGMENLERQRMMAAYDIPPKLLREVCRQNSNPNNGARKPNTNRYSVSCSELKSGNNDLSRFLSDNLSQSFNNHIYTNTPSSGGPSPNRNFSADTNSGNFNHSYQKNKPLTINPLCIIEDEARTAFDRSKRMEAMQKLQKQENDLHKEISLLDEILLVCKKDDPVAQMAREKFSFSEKASSLPNKPKIDTDTSSKSVHSSSESFHKPSSHTDLTKVKKRTKISAPLPYVNLSQFDVGEDNGHVHLSKEGLVTGASTRSLNKSPVPNTVSPAKRSNESLNSSRSFDYHNQSTPAWIREPIYANEPPARPETPPPELPPKGPALLRKNRLSRNSTSFSQGTASTPPPIPPSRNRSRSLGSQGKNNINSSKNQSYDQVVPVPVPVPSKPAVEDTYLMMGDFPSEPRERKKSVTYHDSQDQRRLSKGNADVMSCYMDMAAMFQKESSSSASAAIKEFQNNSHIYDSIDCPIEPAPVPPIRESNYMVMEAKNIRKRSASEEKPASTSSVPLESGSPIILKRNSVIQKLQTLQTYVSTTKAGEAKGSQVTPKPLMPFQNLIDFQPQYKKPAGVYVSHISNQTSQPIVPDEATASPEPVTKEGFLARFKRRNSKDQKATQSTENLMINAKSSKSNILEKSLSEDCESIKSPTTSSPLKIIRQRSSSFPNRRSFQEEEIETDKMVNESLKADSLNDEVFIHTEKSKEPIETFQSKSSIKLNNSGKAEIQEDVNKEMRVLTVLHVQQDPPIKNLYTQFDSSQTDDEKMIALLDDTIPKKPTYTFMSELKSKLTLSLSKTGYEKECSEKDVPSLPPFLPPRNFKLYPTLSPVVETIPSTPPHSVEQESIYVMMKDPKNKKTSSAPTKLGTKPVDDDSDSDPSDISRDSLTEN